MLPFGGSPTRTGRPITGTTITATTAFVAPYGSTGTLAISIGQSNAGFYGVAGNLAYYAGANYWYSAANSFTFRNTGLLGFSSGDPVSLGADIIVSRYAAKQLMVSGDGTGTASGMTGWILGNAGATNSGIYHSSLTPSGANFAVFADASFTRLGGASGSYMTAGGVDKIFCVATAGAGPAITAGTAASDVQALSITQTWNSGGTALKGIKQVITNTASAAGSLDMSLERSTGQGTGISMLSELTTIAAAATTDTTIQMPAVAIVIGVSVRVTTVIPTAATFTVGDSGSAARFSTAAVSTAANSTDAGTKAGAYYNASALAVRITPNLTPADNTGRVRVTIHYILITPPTS